jgi:LPS-assembly lipoprotein
MWWRKHRAVAGVARVAVVLAAAGLTAGCFQPLYGAPPTPGADSVHDKLGEVEIAPIPARQGTPQSRISVAMHNALQFDLNGGAGANAPTHRLLVTATVTDISVNINIASGRPDAQIGGVTASYQLVEIATGKVVLKDSTTAHVDYDIAGSEQRFAQQRAERDAEDRAILMVAETIRNRLASYFVAGT